ncbi:Arc family DNA-binding protein [Flavonifractor plautii]|uniref:Arc family DNA-binding protein n=1 Tax=Flavonifractor plautii TaxID=292800 RepID=UPI0012ABADBF|nr:Arc family DNA-binding protein [Flavonifractor plautii]
MSVSEAQKKASIKYLEKLDEIRIRMPKGEKNNIKEAASAAGESMNQYIINAVDQRMERDNAAPGAAGGATEGTEKPQA